MWRSEDGAGGAAASVWTQPAGASSSGAPAAELQGRAPETDGKKVAGKRSEEAGCPTNNQLRVLLRRRSWWGTSDPIPGKSWEKPGSRGPCWDSCASHHDCSPPLCMLAAGLLIQQIFWTFCCKPLNVILENLYFLHLSDSKSASHGSWKIKQLTASSGSGLCLSWKRAELRFEPWTRQPEEAGGSSSPPADSGTAAACFSSSNTKLVYSFTSHLLYAALSALQDLRVQLGRWWQPECIWLKNSKVSIISKLEHLLRLQLFFDSNLDETSFLSQSDSPQWWFITAETSLENKKQIRSGP